MLKELKYIDRERERGWYWFFMNITKECFRVSNLIWTYHNQKMGIDEVKLFSPLPLCYFKTKHSKRGHRV